MTGIISYGTYIPLWRLNRAIIAPALSGERPVAGFDEDSITMAVAAGMGCLKGFDRQSVDGLFFASTSSPYKEKLAATIVATALDLRRDIVVADFANSLRAGTMALKAALDAIKAGTANQVLVVAADNRLGSPGSEWERQCGDGAGALLVGNSEVISEAGYAFSISDEMLNVWRSQEDQFIRSWENRFIATEGYLRVTREAVTGLMAKYGLTAKEFSKVILSFPDKRRQVELARDLGFDPKTQLQDSLLDQIGDSGTAYSLMLLCAVLEGARAGDRVLCASYGNGSDALTFTATEQIGKLREGPTLRDYVQSKRMVPNYVTYLHWRGLLTEQKPPYPLGEIAVPALWREQEENIRLYGGRCKACGTLQHPPQRICTKCHAKDQFEHVRLSDKKGELVTYSIDYTGGPHDMPTVMSVVNFEGGGRIEGYMTDWKSPEEVKIGMPVEMTFRKLYVREGIHQYLWKSVPVRT